MKSWVTMMHQADKEYEEYGRKLVVQVRCSMLKRVVCDLEIGVKWCWRKNDQCR